MGQQVGSCALAVELQSGEGEPNSASIQACLQQAVVDFSSGTLRVSRSMLVSSAEGEKGTPGGGKEGGVRGSPTHCPGLSAFLEASWVAKSLHAHGMTRGILWSCDCDSRAAQLLHLLCWGRTWVFSMEGSQQGRQAPTVLCFTCFSPRQSRGSDTSPLTRRKSYDRGQPAR